MVRCEPLSFYVEKLERGEPFTSLLYGDGEFTVMSGAVTGTHYTNYQEYITEHFADELVSSLDVSGDDILRASDPFLLQPETYHGRDQASVREIAGKAERIIGDRKITWYDGTVWDVAVREGKLGPFFKALSGRKTVLVGCEKLLRACREQFKLFVSVPEQNACAELEDAGWALSRCNLEPSDAVYCLCCGLSAIPLALRLRRRFPNATYLDLGSTLDIFAGLGGERGWRAELYADPEKLRDVIRRNLYEMES